MDYQPSTTQEYTLSTQLNYNEMKPTTLLISRLLLFMWTFPSHRAFQIPRVRRLAALVRHATILSPPPKVATKIEQHLVIVESPAKCKTIEKILNQQGNDVHYTVKSCMGHIRDLSKSKTPTVRFPYTIAGIDLDSGDFTPDYTVIDSKRGIVRELAQAAQSADRIILATDPDREGEAMAWHLQTILPKTKAFSRLRFTEITPAAITNAVPGEIQMDLVHAQETRRVLDRLAGFTVSPLLWKCIAPGLSAGRVQSVGLRLIVDREIERWKFVSAEYFEITAVLAAAQTNMTVKLVELDGNPVANKAKDFEGEELTEVAKAAQTVHLATKEQAQEWVAKLIQSTTCWSVRSVTSKRRNRQPPVPYKTSTLQQDAVPNGFTVASAMRTAQTLYENGLISYMRTDSTMLSESAELATERAVKEHFQVLPFANKKNSKNNKFAQEAHEAIRPAIQEDGTFRHPDQLVGTLSEYEVRLYRMIFQRTVAYRMPPAVFNQTTIIIDATLHNGTCCTFTTTGSIVVDPGFTRAYSRSDENSDNDQQLPPLSEGNVLECMGVETVQHQTQPPGRYTEASFIKTLEALGIGRPSTYARIVQVLRDRAYISSPKRRQKKELRGSSISAMRASGLSEQSTSSSLIPSLTALCVCDMLRDHCPTYVDPTFTARMEEHLDKIAKGEGDRTTYLNEFYSGESGLAAQVQRVEHSIVPSETRKIRVLPNLQSVANISLNVGPWGPYVVERNPLSGNETKAPLPPGLSNDLDRLDVGTLRALLSMKQEDGKIIGIHKGRNIRAKSGRFGAYLQWGDDGEEGTSTHSLPKEMALISKSTNVEESGTSSVLSLTLEEAIGYVGLPRAVCMLNDCPITTAIGPYGPYLKYNNSYVTLTPEMGDVLSVDSETAIKIVTSEIIEKPNRLPRGVLAELGKKDGGKVQVRTGLFGYYLKWKKVTAKIPCEFESEPETISLEKAWEVIQEKLSNSQSKNSAMVNATSATNRVAPPKRPKSAYLHFCAAKRPEVAERASSLGEISKELAKLWAETSTGDRAIYNDLATKSKRAYDEEIAKWKEMNGQQTKEANTSKVTKSAKAAKTSASNYPKRPKSAYIFFCGEMRPTVAEKAATLGEISKELARLWANTVDRTPYEKLAAVDKQRYEDEKVRLDAAKNKSGKKIPKSSKLASEPKKTSRAPSAYMLFCKEHRSTAAINKTSGEKLSLGDTTKVLASMWRACDDDTKAKFQQLARDHKAQLEVNSKAR